MIEQYAPTLAYDLAKWRARPSQMVRELFGVEPDPWQVAALDTPENEKRIALQGSRGVGTSTVLAWLAWNFVLTRRDPIVAATGPSSEMMRDNFWSEIEKWGAASSLLYRNFMVSKSTAKLKEGADQRLIQLRPFPRTGSSVDQAEVFAGIQRREVLLLVDGASDMPCHVLLPVNAVIDPADEGRIIIAGAPTNKFLDAEHKIPSLLWRVQGESAEKWKVVTVSGDPDDAMRSPRVSLEWAKSQIAAYGQHSPWVRMNVFGEWP